MKAIERARVFFWPNPIGKGWLPASKLAEELSGHKVVISDEELLAIKAKGYIPRTPNGQLIRTEIIA